MLWYAGIPSTQRKKLTITAAGADFSIQHYALTYSTLHASSS